MSRLPAQHTQEMGTKSGEDSEKVQGRSIAVSKEIKDRPKWLDNMWSKSM